MLVADFIISVVCNSARSNSPRPPPDRDTACNFRATWPPEVDRWWRVTSLEKSRETRLSFRVRRAWADESFQIENSPFQRQCTRGGQPGLSGRWAVKRSEERSKIDNWTASLFLLDCCNTVDLILTLSFGQSESDCEVAQSCTCQRSNHNTDRCYDYIRPIVTHAFWLYSHLYYWRQ